MHSRINNQSITLSAHYHRTGSCLPFPGEHGSSLCLPIIIPQDPVCPSQESTAHHFVCPLSFHRILFALPRRARLSTLSAHYHSTGSCLPFPGEHGSSLCLPIIIPQDPVCPSQESTAHHFVCPLSFHRILFALPRRARLITLSAHYHSTGSCLPFPGEHGSSLCLPIIIPQDPVCPSQESTAHHFVCPLSFHRILFALPRRARIITLSAHYHSTGSCLPFPGEHGSSLCLPIIIPQDSVCPSQESTAHHFVCPLSFHRILFALPRRARLITSSAHIRLIIIMVIV